MTQTTRTCAAMIVLIGLAEARCPADQLEWIGWFGDTFHEPESWAPTPGPPGESDTAYLGHIGLYTVNFDGPATSARLVIDSFFQFNLNGYEYALAEPGGLILGEETYAIGLIVRDGTLITKSTSIGLGQAFGDLSFQDGAKWINTGGVKIGDGGGLNNTSVSLSNGAKATCDWMAVGAEPGGGAELQVYGEDSELNCVGEISIGGPFVDGGMTVFSGLVTCASAQLAMMNQSEGLAQILEPGATWIVSGPMIVGGAGWGAINVAGGGRIESGASATLALLTGSNGVAHISSWASPSQRTIGDDLIVGSEGNGWLFIESVSSAVPAEVSVGGSSLVAESPGSFAQAIVIGPGSAWTTAQSLHIGVDGLAIAGVLDGGSISATSTIIGPGRLLAGNSIIVGDLTNGGVLAPGGLIGDVTYGFNGFDSATAPLHVVGDFSQIETGTLVIDVAGINPGEFDQIILSGPDRTIDLGGTLQVNLGDGFQPRAGQEVAFIVGGSVKDAFEAITSAVPVQVIVEDSSLILRFVVDCEAVDLTCDGVIDGEDLGALLLAWGECPIEAGCPADLNGDGVIDGADLGQLLLAWTG